MNESWQEVRLVELKAIAIRGAGINMGAQMVGFLCQTVGVVVLARLLKPGDFGLVAMVTAFYLWPMNFGVNGFTEFIIQKEELGEKEINSIFWLQLFLGILLAIGFAFFGFFLVEFYTEPALSGIAAVMATGIVFQAICVSPMALLRREMKFAAVGIVELAGVILSVVLAISAAIGGMGYWSVVVRQLTIPAVSMIGCWMVCSWRPGRLGDLSGALAGLRYAMQIYCNYTLGYLRGNIDKVLIGKFHGTGSLGVYERSYHLFSVPFTQLLNPLHSVALATLSRLRHDKEQMCAYYTKAVSMVAFPGGLAALLLTISGKDLVFVLLGPKWNDAGPVVMAFGPGIAAYLVYGTHQWLHLSLGVPNRWVKWNLFASVISVIAFVLAAPFGAMGMAITFSGVGYALMLPAVWYAGRPIELKMKVVIGSMWPYFASGVFLCMVWYFLYEYWRPLEWFLMRIRPLFRIIVTAFGMSLLYIAMVCMFERSLRSIRETLAVIKLSLSRKEI